MKTPLQLELLAVLLAGTPALAHEVGHRTASTWSFEPAVVIPLVLSGVLFGIGVWRRRGRPGWSNAQIIFFVAGWLTLFLALVTPLHALG